MTKTKSAKSGKSAKKSPPAKASKKGVELQDKELEQVGGGFVYGAAHQDVRTQKVTIPPIRTGGQITVNKP